MGFVPKRKIYRIEVDTPGHPFEGLWARVKSVPIGPFMELASLADGVDIEALQAGRGEAKQALKMFSQTRDLITRFADALIEWNLEEQKDPDDDDSPTVPVPPTYDGIMSQDLDLAMFLIGEWLGVMGGVNPGLKVMPRQGEASLGADSPETALAALSQPLSPVPS